MLRLSRSCIHISARKPPWFALVLLRLEPLHRAGLEHGLSRLRFVNNGGDMVGATLRMVERRHRFGPHHLATRGASPGAIAYLAYTGSWDYGRQLAEKAIALAGPAAPRWWWWAIAKDYYHKGEYDKALEYFRRSYTEQNWLDHLHVI